MTRFSRFVLPLFAQSARSAVPFAQFINTQAASLHICPRSKPYLAQQHRSFASEHHHQHADSISTALGLPFDSFYTLHHLAFVDQFIESTWTPEEMAKAIKGGYYAVQEGRQPGIYNTWAECEAETKGFSGAVYKKFATKKEAETFVKGNGYGCAPSFSSSAAGSSSSVARTSKYRNRGVLSKPKPSPSSHHTNRGASSYTRPQIFPSSGPKTIVYVDGSCLHNGKFSARAGYGVYFPDSSLSHLSESRRLPGPPKQQTNNRAELTGIIRAIQLCPDNDSRLEIYSDSKYSMSCVNDWIHNWKKNGWKTQMGKEVENKDLIVKLDEEMERRVPRPILIYVYAHAGIEGNEVVDKMAKLGASMPETENDWTIREEE
ncbi:hypothetical protein NDA18_004096 [Ustilago nuda]|nr:hypothetical protein NDA18_004096 [Ustilago nuda]